MGEFGLIDKIKSIVGRPGHKVIKGIGDDCAVIDASGKKLLLLTTDLLVEGVHFRKDFIAPEKLGRKALAVNISDVAAMGGKPLYALLSLAAPREIDVAYIDDIVSGIAAMAVESEVELVGGDVSLSSQTIVINIALIGEVDGDNALYRSGAAPGQAIFVTGQLGASAAGLDILNRGVRIEKYASLIDSHISPRPHLKEAEILSSSGVVASLIDVSDGLVSDLGHICQESKVGAILKQTELPIPDKCRQYCEDFKLNPLSFALYGGEDYVLLGTIPDHSFYGLRELMKSRGCMLYVIGKVTDESGIRLQGESGIIREVAPGGYDHFRSEQD